MRHFIRFIRRFTSACVAAAALSLGANVALAQQGPGVTDTEIKIGAYLPLSGPIASYGIPLLAGMQAAIHSTNEAGGIKGRKFILVLLKSGTLMMDMYMNTVLLRSRFKD